MKKFKITILISIVCNFCAYGAYLTDVPITITQPDGTVIECFATGDEFYNWLHDADGYTIVRDKVTGYYCYAVSENDELKASDYIAGKASPKAAKTLLPYANHSSEKIREIVSENPIYQNRQREIAARKSGAQSRTAAINTGTLNNIVVYIRFAGVENFPSKQYMHSAWFNGEIESMRSYFQESSYNQIDVVSHFYPANNGVSILSYQDSHERGYYCEYDADSNPSGYTDPLESNSREEALLYNAINYVKSEIEQANLDLDYNNDGCVDNVCFIVLGEIDGEDNDLNKILWPHMATLSLQIYINGKRVNQYNLHLQSLIKSTYVGVLCHEMNHTLGAPDLYHYFDYMNPVRDWDIMAISNTITPQHMGAYMKYKYGGWIDSIPSITTFGTYTLQPLSSATNNCYKIPIQGSSQYIVVEYRKITNAYVEKCLPGSGLIIYRINEAYTGNLWGAGAGGVSDEVYIFRPDGTNFSKGDVDEAYFSATAGRTVFSNSSNPYCFTSDGNFGNIYIKNIRENANGTLSFDVRFCDDENITYSNTNNLPALTNASNSIQTSGTVIVKSTDNVTFEARNGVILNAGFKVQPGGTFKMNINDCGEK